MDFFDSVVGYATKYNSVEAYVASISAFFVSLVLLRIFKFVVIRKLRDFAKNTKTDLDDLMIDVVDSIGWPFYILLSIFIALNMITVPEIIITVFLYAFQIAIAIYAIRALGKLIDYATKKLAEKGAEGQDADQAEDEKINLELMANLLKGFVWIITGLFLISSFGYDITALVAGLGIGGIAIAFALQNILGDVFASFSIYFDKPFRKGDFIVIGSDSGIVKKVGIKSTRIQTLQGQELVVSNKELTDIRVHNYKKMQKRRIVFGFGVTYSTPPEKLEKIPGIVKEVIEGTKKTKLDRAHFFKFGNFSLDYEVVYFIDSSEYNVYMDSQQKINLGIVKEFEKHGIEMAFPTQTIHMAEAEKKKK